MARSEREKSIEAYLRRRVLEHGRPVLQMDGSRTDGVPDRICVFPGGRIVFAETKTADGPVNRHAEGCTQQAVFARMRDLRDPVTGRRRRDAAADSEV